MTYEQELADLKEWFERESKRAVNLYKPLPGLDDTPNPELKAVAKEMKRRMDIIKAKYKK